MGRIQTDEEYARGKSFESTDDQEGSKGRRESPSLGCGWLEWHDPSLEEREEEEQRKVGLPDPFEGIFEHTKYWCLARRPRYREGKVVFENPATAKLYERLAQIVEVQQQCLFHPDREKDQITTAIGTAEHSGCVRGVSSSLPWKQAFPNDPGYRKRDSSKKDFEEKMRAIAKEEFSQLLASQQGSLVPNTAQANQEVIVAQSGLIAPTVSGPRHNISIQLMIYKWIHLACWLCHTERN